MNQSNNIVSNAISATIITYNEQEQIENCINSLKDVADEIIVVDSFSNDQTKNICEKLGVKFVEHPFEGHIQQKQYAISLAKHDFILSIDADESLSDELKALILQEKQLMNFNAYSMNRRNYYCGRLIKHCGWYPDKRIRLFNKNMAYWGGENPHDTIIIDKKVKSKHLKADIIHVTVNSKEDLVQQTEKYARIAAKFKYNNQKHPNSVYLKMLINPVSKFLRLYFLKFGFLDGSDGFTICYQEFIYTYKKYKYLYDYYQNNGKG